MDVKTDSDYRKYNSYKNIIAFETSVTLLQVNEEHNSTMLSFSTFNEAFSCFIKIISIYIRCMTS